jgi:hypothetical protein
LVAAEIPGGDATALREAVDLGRKKLGSGVFVCRLPRRRQCHLVVGVTKDLVDKGLKAGSIIKDLAAVVGGGGADGPTWPRPAAKYRKNSPTPSLGPPRWSAARQGVKRRTHCRTVRGPARGHTTGLHRAGASPAPSGTIMRQVARPHCA